jgi:glyoxylase-like metal-dependent hydrolase (beta-lactamase superfamily II)
MQLLPSLYLIPGVIANVYLIVDPDGLTLIDAGLPGRGRKIMDFIASLSYAPSDLKRILITHADIDHVGSLAYLQAACPVTCTDASGPEAEAIRQGHASRPLKVHGLIKLFIFAGERLFKVAPARVDQLLEDGQELPVLGGMRVVVTPGHTPGHRSFFAPEQGVLFSGDSLISRRGVPRVSSGMNTWDEIQARESARLQSELGVRILCPGHGSVVREAAEQLAALAGR